MPTKQPSPRPRPRTPSTPERLPLPDLLRLWPGLAWAIGRGPRPDGVPDAQPSQEQAPASGTTPTPEET
jgi:hypothetical protein